MPTTDDLVQRFSDPSGFKKYFGFLSGGRARRAHELFTTSEESGVTRAYTLDRREHDGSVYFIKAVATRGDIDENTLAELASRAALVPLGSLRYTGMMAATLPKAIGSDDEGAAVHDLSRLDEGIIVYPVSIMSTKAEATYAAWVRKGSEYFVLPLEDKKL